MTRLGNSFSSFRTPHFGQLGGGRLSLDARATGGSTASITQRQVYDIPSIPLAINSTVACGLRGCQIIKYSIDSFATLSLKPMFNFLSRDCQGYAHKIIKKD